MSVKTPKTWHNLIAAGDGVADDTAGLQMTIAMAAPQGGTVYLPPGRYRITDTLLVGTLQESSATRPEGFSLIGHGRDTVIVWDGPDDVPMVRLLGISVSRIVGVTFDAGNRASSVLEMGGPGFQAHNLFRHCAFLNAKFAGIDTGRKRMNTACTEQRIDNCLFVNCGRGVSLGDFNDYDCVIEGSEFRDCDYGVWTFKGNFYCRDSHFERSREADFRIESEHTSTIRRCTSTGSNRFLIQRSPHCGTVIQDCRVADWKAADGAILQNIVPAMIFDSVFSGAGPVIRFIHTDSESLVGCNKGENSKYFKLISSGNRIENARPYQAEAEVRVYDIPVTGDMPDSGLSAATSFLKTRAVHGVWSPEARTAAIPGKIFDVKRDFGAKGGEYDDTEAFRQAIAVAKAHGNGAFVYMPPGHYTVRETLKLDGDNYYFGGSGVRSILSWYGAENGTLLHVDAPKRLGLEGFETMRLGGRKDGIDILHTGGGSEESFTTYDTVRVFGFLTPQPLVRGLRFRNLGANDRVVSKGTFGNLHFIDSQAAEILFNNHYEGVILVEGKNPERTGLLAFQFALLELCDPCLWIKDNNSLVMTDFYNEQSTSLYRFEGNGSPERGRISLGSIKVEAVPRYVEGFQGEITLGTPQYYQNSLHGRSRFDNDEASDVDYLELGGYYFVHSLDWNRHPGFRARFLGTGGGPDKDTTAEEFLRRYTDSIDPEALEQAARFFHDMRRVGELDLRLNFPGI